MQCRIGSVGVNAYTASGTNKELIVSGRGKVGIGCIGPDKSSFMNSFCPATRRKSVCAVSVVISSAGHRTILAISLVAVSAADCAIKVAGGVAFPAADRSIIVAGDVILAASKRSIIATGPVSQAAADSAEIAPGLVAMSAADGCFRSRWHRCHIRR